MKQLNLKKLREKVGMSQADLAAKSKISFSNICKIEQGKGINCKMSTLLAFKDALGLTSVEDLFFKE
jgi:predicted transcriptional regulator